MKPLVLAILDGWGYSARQTGNPIALAHKPNLDQIAAAYPMALLQASGIAVGLRWGDFGNSEVGHLTIGAGRTIQQYSLRIDNAIKDGSFFENPVLLEAFGHPRVHLIGLLTSGNVHASWGHLQALIELAERSSASIMLHLFTDGKDSGIHEGATLLKKLPVPVTTIIGRDFGMDRDGKIELTQQAHDLIAFGKGERTDDFVASLQNYYQQGLADTNIPALATPSYDGAKPGDVLLFFNFREDSMRQIYESFENGIPEYSMTKYTENATLFAYAPPDVKNNITEVISSANMRQLHIAESEKYAHVTYFFNGFRNSPYPGEEDMLIQSVKNVEQMPQMGAQTIADEIIAKISQYDVIVANFANADILAHTGNYAATQSGVEAVDRALGSIMRAVLECDGTLIITSDHGNAESLIDRMRSEPESRHDISPVPFYLVGKKFQVPRLTDGQASSKFQSTEISGILADIAPTILDIMEIPKPIEMTGVSLLPTLLDSHT